jgi:hypothetical protein
MLKISKIRPCENNKSCNILHYRSKKNWFGNFLNFLRFSTLFTSFCKSATLLKMRFAPRPSERSKTLQLGPRFVDKPLERKWTLQLGPWPRGTAGSPEFRRLRRRARAGNGSGSSKSSPRTYWWPGLGQRCRRRGSSTAAGGGGRGGAVSGEEAARGGQGAGRACRASAREAPSNSHGAGVERGKGFGGGANGGRRGEAGGSGWRGGGGELDGLLYARLEVTTR